MQDQITRHQIWLQRYAGGLHKNDVIPVLEEIRDRIMQRLATPTLSDLQNTKRLAIILSDIEVIIQSNIGKINPSLWKELADYENEYNVKLLDDATLPSVVIGTGLNPTALSAITASSTVKMVGQPEMTITDMVKVLSDRHYQDIKNEIQVGIASGDTLQAITKRVKELSDTRSRQQSEAVVRTVTNHISNEVRMGVFGKYDHLFKGVKWVSTLDSRTSPICMSRDGRLYPLSKHPSPPAHYNCRSVLVHVVKDEYDIMKGSGSRSSADGYMPAEATYNDWLKRQSHAVQNEILGKARAEAYRKSGESIDRFIDRKGQFYSLKDLKKADNIDKVVKTQNVSFGYDGKFDKYVADIREDAKTVINKLPKPSKIMVGKGVYTSSEESVSTPENKYVFLHEYGHHIDYKINKSKVTAYSEMKLQDAMEADYKHIGLNSTKKRAEIIQQFKDTHYEKIIKTRYSKIMDKEIEYSIVTSKNDVARAYSDIIDSMMNGKAHDKFEMYGHGSKYYKQRGRKDKENFANLFSIWAEGNNWDEAKQLFPNLTAKFEQIMKDVIDGKIN